MLLRRFNSGLAIGPLLASLVLAVGLVAAEPYAVEAVGAVPELSFDGGTVQVIDHEPGTWRVFRVEVPWLDGYGSPTLGWELRIPDASFVGLRAVVRHGQPLPVADHPTVAPFGSTIELGPDLTGRWTSHDGEREGDGGLYGLLPFRENTPWSGGTYYVGVQNTGTEPVQWTLHSRGVGGKFGMEPIPLVFNGFAAPWPDLPPRGTALYAIYVPGSQSSMVVATELTRGDVRIHLAAGTIPGMKGSYRNIVGPGLPSPTMAVYKAGDERITLMPAGSDNYMTPGIYYALVIAEGEDPAGDRIGDGMVTGQLRSHGALVPKDAGLLAPGDEVRIPLTFESGEVVVARAETTEDVLVLEARLVDLAGDVSLVIGGSSGERYPNPYVYSTDVYSPRGGTSSAVSGPVFSLLSNPPAGRHHFTVGPTGGHYNIQGSADRELGTGSATLVIRAMDNLALAFDPVLETPELPATVSGTLLDGQRRVHVIDVPESVDGEPLLGMLLHLQASEGQAAMSVTDDTQWIGLTANHAEGWRLFTAEQISPGRWYVVVTGTGDTQYTLSSRAVRLARAEPFVLPAGGQVPAHPGLPPGTIGDSGINPDGTPMPGDQGIDLEDTEMHFYRLDIEPGNEGLLRIELIALQGNPQLFMEVGNLPALSSSMTRATLRRMVAPGTQRAVFVPMDARDSGELPSGTHYIAVRAEGGAARYRLQMQAPALSGPDSVLTPLPADGTVVTGDGLALGDWRYYRVDIPPEPTATLRVFFQHWPVGVSLAVRQGAFPGHARSNVVNHSFPVADWSMNPLNKYYQIGTWVTPNTLELKVPPLRPGEPLYLGIRGITTTQGGATFSLSAEWIGTPVSETHQPFTLLDYDSGHHSFTLPPGGRALWRVRVPEHATRWQHTATHSSQVVFYLEQGTIPPNPSGAHKWLTLSYNQTSTSFSQHLGGWPWLPGRTYYLLAVNQSSTASQNVGLFLNGKDATNDDHDRDGMLDAWERHYFGYLGEVPGGDPDGDGLSNLREFQDGTDPTDPDSARYRISITGFGATPRVSPPGGVFDRWTSLEFTAEADDPAAEVRWWRFRNSPFDGSPARPAVVRVLGGVVIPQTGTYTLHIRSSHRMTAWLGGYELYARDGLSGIQEVSGALMLDAGTYLLEAIFQTDGAMDSFEFGTALGTQPTWDPARFKALGDVAGGGLAVVTPNGQPGFLVEAREPMGGKVLSRTQAIELMAEVLPSRWRAFGSAQQFNFGERSSVEGRYPGQLPYPRVFQLRELQGPSNGDIELEAVAGLALDSVLGTGATIELTTPQVVPWVGVRDATAPGGLAARSGPVDRGGKAEFRMRLHGSGLLRFHWRLSTTPHRSSVTLKRQTNGGSATTVASLTRASDWTEVLAELPEGEHELRFEFSRSGWEDTGDDWAAVAGLRWPAELPLGEALDAPYLAWTSGGSAAWTATVQESFDGLHSARSGPVGHNQHSQLSTTVQGPGTLSFRWKVSSEPTRDPLVLLVNGIEADRISGEVDWTHREVALPAGPHSIVWRFVRDGSGGGGANAVWLDNVAFHPDDSYEGWKLHAGLEGAAALPEADPSGSGVSNLVRYAFGLDPRSGGLPSVGPSVLHGMPGTSVDVSDDGPQLVVEMVVRRDPQLQVSVHFSDHPGGPGVPGIADVGEDIGDFQRIRFHDPAPGDRQRFAVIQLER